MDYKMKYFILDGLIYAYPTQDRMMLLVYNEQHWNFSHYTLSYLETDEDLEYISEREALEKTNDSHPSLKLDEFYSKEELAKKFLNEQNPKIK